MHLSAFAVNHENIFEISNVEFSSRDHELTPWGRVNYICNESIINMSATPTSPKSHPHPPPPSLTNPNQWYDSLSIRPEGQLEEEFWIKFKSKYKDFHLSKCIWQVVCKCQPFC